MRLALALSGGGVRAAVFHWGVLQRLALDGLLERTTFVSTVSGGSLVTGLILCRNGHRWPTSDEYLAKVLPAVGDYLTHYVVEPDVPISDAIAASAAVPGLIGPLVVRSSRYRWNRYEGTELVSVSTPLERYELWDGGVYDNLGVEPLFKSGGGFREGFDLLVVSDASAPLGIDPRTLKRMIKPGHRTLRLVDIATDQVRGLRSRAVVAEFRSKRDAGAYFRMGNTVERIYTAAGLSAPPGDYLSGEDVEREATFPTTLRRLTPSEFTRLRRHGFEVADATLATRLSDRFHPVRPPVDRL